MKSALESSWLGYEHVDTVVVQGTTVVLAREAPSAARGATGSESIASLFCFNVLPAFTDGSGTAPKWVGFRKLSFPRLLPVGLEIVNVLTCDGENHHLAPVTDAGGRFRAVPLDEFIYIFRCSTDGTLLSTRFHLIREGATAIRDRVDYSLESPLEVRFQVREKLQTPVYDQGAQNYLNSGKEPFCEPTFELSMVRGLSADSFDVEIVPVAGERALCHVFQVLPDQSKIRMCSLPIDESGQYDLQSFG